MRTTGVLLVMSPFLHTARPFCFQDIQWSNETRHGNDFSIIAWRCSHHVAKLVKRDTSEQIGFGHLQYQLMRGLFLLEVFDKGPARALNNSSLKGKGNTVSWDTELTWQVNRVIIAPINSDLLRQLIIRQTYCVSAVVLNKKGLPGAQL